MSKKVLNYAGRRPMLLAVIMTTLTLGLLFSGWLTPTPGRAQAGGENPLSNIENTNCVATTNAWTGSCPSIVTNGLVSPTTIYQCGVTGPEMPTNIVVPVYSPTNIFTQIITYSTTNCTPVTNTENITYSVSGYFWTNFSSPYTSMPSKVTNSFSADCDVYVTSSDTNNCASPGLVNLATVTWDLPCPTITSLTIDGCGVIGPPVLENGVLRLVYGAIIHYNFQCANGWYSWEANSFTQDCDTTDNSSLQQTTATSDPWYNTGDGVGTTVVNPSALPCSLVSHQTIYFAPVGGGGVANNNSTCSFNFTRTLTIAPDSGNPGHGTITLEVTGLANPVTSSCAY
jgi:hypothetical protein